MEVDAVVETGAANPRQQEGGLDHLILRPQEGQGVEGGALLAAIE